MPRKSRPMPLPAGADHQRVRTRLGHGELQPGTVRQARRSRTRRPNPAVYLVSGFRWSFYENADVAVGVSLSITAAFLLACLVAVWWIFRSGYRLRS